MSDNVRAWLRRPWFGPCVALLLVYALFAILSPDTFPRATILESMVLQTVVVAISAVGMTLIMVGGGIDLSVGSLVALRTVVVARLLERGVSPPMDVLLAETPPS